MPTPSLILVPARFKTGKLYTPVATTSGGVVLGASGDFNVTRATTATRFNSAGLIESVASGVPRLDYYTSGGTAGCPALLVEPSAQNLATNSEVWNGNWNTALNTTLSGNTTGTTDPYGTNVADTMFETTANDSHAIFRDFTVVSGTTYTFSFFVKSVALRNVQVIGSSNFPGNTVQVNLSTLAITGDGSGTCRVSNFGNGWARIAQTYTATGTNGRILIYSLSGTTASFAGSTNNGLYVFGAQLETGSIATSYIPTTAAAATRNADVISVTGPVSGCIGQTEGTFYVEFQASPSGSTSNWLNISDNTTNNWLFIGKDGINTRLYLRANNVVIFSNETTPLTGGVVKAAIGYKSGDYAAYINGNLIVSGTTAFSFSSSLNRIHNGSNIAEPSLQISRYRSVALYTTRLTNQELAALTTP